MPRLILHIGTYKTEPRYMQRWLSANASLLEKQGVFYPKFGQDLGHNKALANWLEPDTASAQQAEDFWGDVGGQIAKQVGDSATVLLSAQELSRGWPRRVNLSELREKTKAFDEVLVVGALRDQYSYIEAIYESTSLMRNPGPIAPYVDAVLQNGHVEGVFADYLRLHHHLLTGFDAQEIHYINHQEASKSSHGVLGHLLEHCGLDEHKLDSLSTDDVPKNQNAANPLASHVANLVSLGSLAPARLRELAIEMVAKEFGEAPQTTAFSTQVLAKIRGHFETGNKAFESVVRQVQPRFSMPGYSDFTAGKRRFDELSTGSFLVLARKIREEKRVGAL